MAKKQRIVMLGGAGFNGTITSSVIVVPTPIVSLTIDITKSNVLEISEATALTYSAEPTVDGTRVLVELQNTTSGPLTVSLPASPAAWSIDHGQAITSFVLPAYGRCELVFRWDDDDSIWVVTSVPMTKEQVKAALVLAIADIPGLQALLDSYATSANAALTGAPTAPTADQAVNNDQISTTAYVRTAISAIGAGDGDVVGPVSSTDDAIAVFNGTGGKTIKNSGVTIDPTTGNVVVKGDSIPGSITLFDAHATTPKFMVHTAPETLASDQRIIWPSTPGTAGQVLAVDSVVGTAIVLEWVTP